MKAEVNSVCFNPRRFSLKFGLAAMMVVLLAAPGALADEKVSARRSATKPEKKSKAAISKERAVELTPVEVTGSLLKHKVKKTLYSTPSAAPLTVLTSADIERTGAATVAQALSRGRARP